MNAGHKTMSLRLPLGLYEQLEREAISRKISVATLIIERINHESRGDDRNRNAVPDISPQQGVRVHNRAAQQPESYVIERRHA